MLAIVGLVLLVKAWALAGSLLPHRRVLLAANRLFELEAFEGAPFWHRDGEVHIPMDSLNALNRENAKQHMHFDNSSPVFEALRRFYAMKSTTWQVRTDVCGKVVKEGRSA